MVAGEGYLSRDTDQIRLFQCEPTASDHTYLSQHLHIMRCSLNEMRYIGIVGLFSLRAPASWCINTWGRGLAEPWPTLPPSTLAIRWW